MNRSFNCRAGGHSHYSTSCISQERIESTELQNSSPIDIKNENNTRSTVHVEEEEIRKMIESLAKVIHTYEYMFICMNNIYLCMHVCIYIYIHTITHTNIFIYIHTYIHTYILTYITIVYDDVF